LCHSREMNHGPRFWALLNSFIEGNATLYRREMNKIVRTWYDESDPRYLLITNK